MEKELLYRGKLGAGLIAELANRADRAVTRTVAAWKLDHGLRRHGIDLGYVLDLIVPSR